MAKVLRAVGIPLYSPNPDAVVTKAKANAVFFRYDDFFKNWNFKTKTVQGLTTTHVDTGVGGTASDAPEGFVPPASPIVP